MSSMGGGGGRGGRCGHFLEWPIESLELDIAGGDSLAEDKGFVELKDFADYL